MEQDWKSEKLGLRIATDAIATVREVNKKSEHESRTTRIVYWFQIDYMPDLYPRE